ncbi:heterokaryon incompatibility protein-domain-containing protein [Ustulina deusta]|nr:heterokaryon incompatibility protein-domain-containing protein [Ustulina deusta]
MRLINSRNLQIEEFRTAKVPAYAILSHTWGNSEASPTEWNSRFTRLKRSKRAGFAKILSACKRARQDGLSYVWVDTVCIDKSSSAELSEAINSMFNWYQNAVVCYIFLEDVPSDLPDQVAVLDVLRRSRWFTRGWTLQELLAPDYALFFTCDWVELGTKKGLASAISRATGIDQLCLCKEKKLQHYSIAQRMAWAATRSTTREEDIAYSLLGIFDINMPLLYGEGGKAFRRLQEEIIKASDDHSILTFNPMTSRDSLLADHPRLFGDLGKIQPRIHSRLTPPFHLTNAGLSLSTPLIRTLSPFWVLAVLNCFEEDTMNGSRLLQICLPLLGKDNIYMRARKPVFLVKRPFKDAETELGYRMLNLTTSTVTSYLVSYFTRVYPSFGGELDHVMKGFEDDDVQKSGFMLTFPRGMGNYRVVAAYPPEALQEETSLFCPAFGTAGQPFSHGLVVFEEIHDDRSTNTTTSSGRTSPIPKQIGVYLAQTDDFVSSHWMCRLISNPDERFYQECSNAWPFETDPLAWGHYDHIQHFIVAARSQLVFNTRPRQVVLVDIVFDVDPILQNNSALRSNQYLGDVFKSP